MGTYIYKTMAQNKDTDLGRVYLAKYVTKVGCAEPKGKGGRDGTYLMAYELKELAPVYKVRTGNFWYDSMDMLEVGWLRKHAKRKPNRLQWYVSLDAPTRGEQYVQNLDDTGTIRVHSGSFSGNGVKLKGKKTDGEYDLQAEVGQYGQKRFICTPDAADAVRFIDNCF